MKKIWNKIADIATEIFGVAMGLIFLVLFLFVIGLLITGNNKFVFSILLLILISGLLTVIDWLIEN